VTLPNFLIIGAHKGASTSLRAYLGAHPDVYVAPALEPSFFAIEGQERPEVNVHGPGYVLTYTLSEYEALFDGVTTEKAIGEKSPAYLTSSRAPGRIKELIPDVRLIAVLRNPADRAFSHYLMDLRGGSEDLSFAEAVVAERNKQRKRNGLPRHYVKSGKYAHRIQRYQSLFGAEQLRVFLYEDLVLDMPSVMREIYEYVGVDSSFEPDLSVRHNAKPSQHRNDSPRAKLHQLGSTLVGRRPIQPASPKMSAATRVELLDFYRDDVLQLQTLIGRDLSAWLETQSN
jgi:hypothetical protein